MSCGMVSLFRAENQQGLCCRLCAVGEHVGADDTHNAVGDVIVTLNDFIIIVISCSGMLKE